MDADNMSLWIPILKQQISSHPESACPYGQLHPEPKQKNALVRESAHTYREIELVFIATTHHHICDCIDSPVNQIFDCIDSPVDV